MLLHSTLITSGYDQIAKDSSSLSARDNDGVLADIESLILSSSFSSFQASFIPRSFNGPADSYAKASLCTKLFLLGLISH